MRSLSSVTLTWRPSWREQQSQGQSLSVAIVTPHLKTSLLCTFRVPWHMPWKGWITSHSLPHVLTHLFKGGVGGEGLSPRQKQIQEQWICTWVTSLPQVLVLHHISLCLFVSLAYWRVSYLIAFKGSRHLWLFMKIVPDGDYVQIWIVPSRLFMRFMCYICIIA